MKILIILAVIGAVSSSSLLVPFFNGVILEEFETFKTTYNKTYQSDVEERFRLKIFMENKRKIAVHNRAYERGEVSYSMAMNSFGDLLHDEFVSNMNGFKRINAYRDDGDGPTTYIPPYSVTVPGSVDWRKQGAVTEVKDQGQCGSCWAFSATGSLEGQHFRKSGKLVSLSEQNLVDCSRQQGNMGCNGGLMDLAFRYIKANGGIDTETSYPYEGHNDQCHYNPRDSGATDNGYVDLPKRDENALKIAVATTGPISVAIDASQDSFQFYHSGVYYSKSCSSTNLDHGVLVVGYGTTPQRQDYWLVKNSWGQGWGMSGYIEMARNKENNCGIASAASYPLV